MKPTPQFNDDRDDRGSTGLRQGAAFPKTDFNFKASSADFSAGRGGKAFPPFRGISADYFGREARGHFAAEAAFFALIVVTVSVPLFQVARVLIDWVL